MERQLTEGRPFGVLLRYALPVLGGNLFQLFYTLADTARTRSPPSAPQASSAISSSASCRG